MYFQGLKYQDAADVLDIPVGTVKSRLHAALTKLTEEWDEADTECGSAECRTETRLAATRSGAGEAMTDQDLTGYLLNALDADDRVAVRRASRADPDAMARLDRLRLALRRLKPLAKPTRPRRDWPSAPSAVSPLIWWTTNRARANRPSPGPRAPTLRTALAESLVVGNTTPRPAFLAAAPREEPETAMVGGRFRPDVIVAGGIALFAAGLIFSAVGKVRARNEMLACHNTLRITHGGLAGLCRHARRPVSPDRPRRHRRFLRRRARFIRPGTAGLPPRLPRLPPGRSRHPRTGRWLYLHTWLSRAERRPRRPAAAAPPATNTIFFRSPPTIPRPARRRSPVHSARMASE